MWPSLPYGNKQLVHDSEILPLLLIARALYCQSEMHFIFSTKNQESIDIFKTRSLYHKKVA